METMQELIPFVREMLSQRSGRGVLKVYLVGSLLAVMGTVIGLVETVCHPFCGGRVHDAEMAMLLCEEPRRTLVAGLPAKTRGRREEEVVHGETYFETDKPTLSKTHGPQVNRTAANRLHAS
ncbi:unnamed protein product [Merluccius merluccius]